MATSPAIRNAPLVPAIRKASRGYYAESFARFRRDRISMLTFLCFILICAISFSAPWTTENFLHTNPNRQNLLRDNEPPSLEHWGGTDGFGRDALARVLYAGQVSLSIGFAVTSIQLTIGIILGLMAGYYHGWVDDLINAVILTRLGIPTLYLLILLSVTFRGFVGTPVGLSIIFGILGWTGVARQIRGLVLSVRQRDYVDAAKVVGADDRRIMFRHILPNVMYIVLVIAGFDIVGAMLGEAGLSYLGLGIQPPTASWGNMLAGSLDNFQNAPHLVFLPGFFIMITVLCIFVTSDGLRDALDPRLKE